VAHWATWLAPFSEKILVVKIAEIPINIMFGFGNRFASEAI
jgi:hypothetical protein